MEEGAPGCLGVVGVVGSLVVVEVEEVGAMASPACSEASSTLGSACPCSSVSLQLLHLEPLGEGRQKNRMCTFAECTPDPSCLSCKQRIQRQGERGPRLGMASPVGSRVMLPGSKGIL